MRDYINELASYLRANKIKQVEIADKLGISKAQVNSLLKGRDKFGERMAQRWEDEFGVNKVWLMFGEGEMLKTETPQEIKEVSFEDAHKYPKGDLIPYFAETFTRGGLTDRQAPMNIEEHETSYINAGSIFSRATSAIKHVGDSMIEYPSGCILFCRQVENPSLLVNGSSYVIETTEYRVTKKIHDKGNFIRAFSTNEQKFPDGSLIYEPFDIPKTDIVRLHQILGYAYLNI